MKNSGNKWVAVGIAVVLIAAATVFFVIKKTGKKSSNALSGVPIIEGNQDMSKYYKSEEYKRFYGKPVPPPPFNFNVDLAGKKLLDLRLLENEVYARHHFLFTDAMMRGYFNQFKWYQPIFWDSTYRISLTPEEVTFLSKLNTLEQGELSKNLIDKDGKRVANMDNVVNFCQFKSVPAELKDHLSRDGCAIMHTQNMQLYNTYETNDYNVMPSFVTSDVYLQLMHMHFSNIMRNLEEHHYYDVMKKLMQALYKENMALAANKNVTVQNAAAFNTCFYGIAYSIISGQKTAVPPTVKKYYDEEMAKIRSFSGRKSDLLGTPLLDYTQLKPRGYYTRSANLKKYFTCMKWLMTAPVFLDKNDKLASAVLTANILQTKTSGGEPLVKAFNSIDNTFNFLVGMPDNLSIADIVNVMAEKNLSGANIAVLLSEENIAMFRTELGKRNPEKIHFQGATEVDKQQLGRTAVYFMPGRYTFDAEILQRMVNALKPDPKRPMPRGLDVFAALGNKTAEDILLNTYHEAQKWPQYTDSLNRMKTKFADFKDWDKSAYNKGMECAEKLQKTNSDEPYYMQLPAWDKKKLNASLGFWAELKHDVVLYAKQPMAAEMGDGGDDGPEPPIYPGYVEPCVEFWQNCIDMLNLTSAGLEKNGIISNDFTRHNTNMKNLAAFLLSVSQKELKHENLSPSEFETIRTIGGQIEGITMDILGNDRDLNDEDNPDRYAACVADVYTYLELQTDDAKCLEEATGMGDEIYVVAEINGFLYLTRGAVFSYYEFSQPAAARLTDEGWHKMLDAKQQPPAPEWMQSTTVPTYTFNTLPSYTYNAYPVGMKTGE